MAAANLLNAVGLMLGFVGASILWDVSRREGPGLPFYADAEGKLLAQMATESQKRDSRKSIGVALIACGFLCQLLAQLF